MFNRLMLVILLLLAPISSFAFLPQGLRVQAVFQDPDGNLLVKLSGTLPENSPHVFFNYGHFFLVRKGTHVLEQLAVRSTNPAKLGFDRVLLDQQPLNFKYYGPYKWDSGAFSVHPVGLKLEVLNSEKRVVKTQIFEKTDETAKITGELETDIKTFKFLPNLRKPLFLLKYSDYYYIDAWLFEPYTDASDFGNKELPKFLQVWRGQLTSMIQQTNFELNGGSFPRIRFPEEHLEILLPIYNSTTAFEYFRPSQIPFRMTAKKEPEFEFNRLKVLEVTPRTAEDLGIEQPFTNTTFLTPSDLYDLSELPKN